MRLAIGAVALSLAACQRQPQGPAENQQVPENQAATAPESPTQEAASNVLSKPTTNSEALSEPPGERLASLPSADAPLRFVGRWAAKAGYCADKAWRFTATSLSTPAGSHCDFSNVQQVAGGYDIAARCTAEGPETADLITLRFAESARAMLLESKTIAGSGLIYCGK